MPSGVGSGSVNCSAMVRVPLDGATNVNALASVALCPSGLVTLNAAAPALSAGVTAVICRAVTLLICSATPPSVAFNPVLKFCPLMVIDVPPAAGPLDGEAPAMEGAGAVVAAL